MLDDEKKQQLSKAGIDMKEVEDRFMGNMEMLEHFLLKFTHEQSFQKMVESMELGDVENAYEAAHSLKGVAANLSMIPLNGPIAKQSDYLKNGNLDAAKQNLPIVKEQYIKIQNALKILQE